MPKSEKFTERNQAVRSYVKSCYKRYPHWKVEAVIAKAAAKFYLAERTIEAILKGEGSYA